MYSQLADTLFSLWPDMLRGAALLLVGTGTGLVIGRYPPFLLVKGIAWWVKRVVLPLVTARTWRRRTAMIFLNNGLVLTAVVALGTWPSLALSAIAALGLNLGIALRILGEVAAERIAPPSDPDQDTGRRIRIGMVLNMLEPPAIVVALGLALGRQPQGLDSATVWLAFGACVVPALLLAAAGEALWLGEYRRNRAGPRQVDADFEESPQ